ncbi:MAG: alpha-L-fucosidase [Opitutaceae bacterium]
MNKYRTPLTLCAAMASLLIGFPSFASAEKEQGMDEMWGRDEVTIEAKHPGLKWFSHDKYAMFIHWGLYSEMGGVWKGKTHYGIGEWIMHMAKIPVGEYKAYAKNFNPDKFDATELVKLAKAAGMKTIVITSKHHEGFAMFDSKVSDFTVTKATPSGRDLMKELADACAAEGMRLGFYYSQNQDWTEPYGGNYKGKRPKGYKPEDFNIYFQEKVVPQVTELLTNYGPISMIWFDTPGGMDKKYSAQLVELVTEHQPGCLINSRIGGGYGDYVSLGDMHIPAVRPKVGVWETVDTTNNSWSYAWYDQNWKSPKEIAERLVRVAARGGSYMLNVGPKGDGSLPAKAVETLEESGAWIQSHGEAIYGTTGSPFDQGFSWGDITRKGDDIYLHVFDWPAAGQLRLADLGAKVTAAEFLHDSTKVGFTQDGSIIEVNLGSQVGRDLPLISVVKLKLDGPAKVTHQATQLDGLTSATLLAKMSEVKGCKVKERRWMEKFGEWKHDYFVQEWSSEKAKVTWDINVLKAGEYLVSIEYSCEDKSSDSEWTLTCGDESMTFITYESGFDPSKSFQPGPARERNFKVDLGVLNIPEGGLQQLEVTPRKLKGNGIGLVSVSLQPYR